MRLTVLAFVAATACSVSAQTTPRKPQDRGAASNAPTPSVAAPAETKWEKEPSAFLGIKLGAPFDVRPCPTKRFSQYSTSESLDFAAMKSLDGVCVNTSDSSYRHQSTASGRYTLENIPDLGIFYRAHVQLKNSVVSKVTLELKQANFGVLLSAFKDRYGTPTYMEADVVKSNAGAEFAAAKVRWQGEKLSIHMYERFLRIDESHVIISDNAIMEEEVAALRAKRASEAQKF
jgi:hypothetical protein